jgi:hypothetical protein
MDIRLCSCGWQRASGLSPPFGLGPARLRHLSFPLSFEFAASPQFIEHLIFTDVQEEVSELYI